MIRRAVVRVDKDIAAQVLNEAVEFAPLETGGVLLGTRDDESGQDIIATELVGAGPNARRERRGFTPDGPWQREQIAKRYEASGRTLAYLGDWHSHPHGNGPSDLDRSTALRIAGARTARCPNPTFLIATRTARGWELRTYRFGRTRLRRSTLEER